ncbi:MAG: M61 family metallopeptidase [Deltaproteobacteria bacterium]|nr:M61 family metallopeptidase [Deltaproteobacteria bacterium]
MSPAPIRYRVAMPEPASHEFHVTMDIPPLPERQSLDIVFPVWAPGSYMVRDFSRHVYELAATAGGRSLALERLDKARWRLQTGGRAATVRYRVFAFEQSVRTSVLDDSHAFWNGTSLFFLVDGETARPCLLEVEPAPGWRISTALPALRGRPHAFRAADYDELVDSPVEIGTHALFAFRAGGARFQVAWQGESNVDRSRMLATLRRIVEATGAMFGGFPFDRYLFIVHALPARGGGLEHARSCALDIAGFSFEDEKGYQSFAELAAHEFFHVWNVKRIHDRCLGPFDYAKENYTRLLWFHEGFTEYMQGHILLRAGLLATERYLKDLAEDWTRYRARPGRNVTPLSELSYEAWIKQYKPAENHQNRMVSYYDKGRWAALVLDLLLRQATRGRRGLPELFARLWRRVAARGRPVDAAIIRREAEALAGRSLSSYFGRYIDGTAELPVPDLLRTAGIEVEAAAPGDANDPVRAKRLQSWCGLVFAGNGEGERATLKNVVPNSPAWRAGLTYNDEVVAVDGIRVGSSTVAKRLADHAPGQSASLAFFRKDRLREATLRMRRSPERRWSFALDPEAPDAARTLRRHWLGARD